MGVAESTVTRNVPAPASGTLAQQLVAGGAADPTLGDGMVIGRALHRGAAYAMDLITVLFVVNLLSGFKLVLWAWSFSLLLTWQFHYVLASWGVIVAAHYLYFAWTGGWLGRSLGQRMFGLAVSRPDGALLDSVAWRQRSWRKCRYVVPLIGLLGWGLLDTLRAARGAHHRTGLDVSTDTVVVVAASLPPDSRTLLR